uniref:Uncharacterized protein n=1 Tax=Aegilops tauschii subsp. strangulata TaxID=200361 RepID=A0A453EER7_AEGTS
MKLRCALQMLKPDGEGEDFIEKVGQPGANLACSLWGRMPPLVFSAHLY